jgi:hypothetical protein
MISVSSRNKNGLLCLTVFLAGMAVFSGELNARTFYVAPRGSDDALGTEAFPWRTIQHACDELEPGDTAIIQEGIYNEQVYVEVEGNEEDGPITLQGEGKAVVTAQGLKEDNIFYIEDKKHICIIGLELRDLETEDGSGIRFEGSGKGLEFRNNVIHSIRGKNAMGITIYGTNADESVSGIVIEGNEIYDCDAAPSEALTLNGNVENFRVANNHLHDIVGIGIDFIGGEKSIVKDQTKVARDGVCRGNRVERARANYGGGFGAGIYVDGGVNIIVENNWVTECDLGIEVGAENKGVTVTGVEVRGNVIWNNDKAGIVFGGFSPKVGRVNDCRFFNNLCRQNTNHPNAEAELWIQHGSRNRVWNNLFVGGSESKKPLLYSGPKDQENDLDYNLWFTVSTKGGDERFVWKGRSYSSMDSLRSGTGIARNSQFADPALADDGFHLTSESPAIDAGHPETPLDGEWGDIGGNLRLQGARIDIGVHEFGGS